MNAPRLSGCPHPRPVTASTCPVGPSPDPRGHDPPPGASLLRAGLSRCRGELTLPLQRSFTSLHPSLPPPHLLGPAPLTPSCHRGLVAVLLLTPPFSTHLAKSPTIAGHMPQVTERLALPPSPTPGLADLVPIRLQSDDPLRSLPNWPGHPPHLSPAAHLPCSSRGGHGGGHGGGTTPAGLRGQLQEVGGSHGLHQLGREASHAPVDGPEPPA